MMESIKWVNQKKIERTIKALEKNNMSGYFAKDEKELFNIIEGLLKEGDLVACGGSMSLFNTKIIDYLKNGKYNFLDRHNSNLKPEDVKEIYRKSFFADAYFASTNAITENGELYNVDGNGNRVAAMLYGPDKVILIVGVNKIVKDVQEAINRNKYVCAPANAKRLGTRTPCQATGVCMDCSSPERICCEYTLIKKQRTAGRMHVIFINENIGY
nr:lactate utilization protein [Romboutsia sp. Marseille-P6047]